MRKSHPDPERSSRIRVAAGVLLALGGTITLAAVALTYGQSGAAINNGFFGIFLAALSVLALRNPLGAATLTLLTGAIGLWLAASPFVLDYFRYTITAGMNVWVGLMVTLLSAFIYGEARAVNQPLDAHD
jgi:hypothetical protein